MRGRFSRWLTARAFSPDALIDDLIAANKAEHRPGMAHPDWRTMHRRGAEQWARIVAGQARYPEVER